MQKLVYSREIPHNLSNFKVTVAALHLIITIKLMDFVCWRHDKMQFIILHVVCIDLFS